MLKIALDLDDTIFVWRKTHEDRFHCKIAKTTPSKITEQVDSLKHDGKFWSNLPLLERPDFNPWAYVSKRTSDKLFTINCLKKYKLPQATIIFFKKQEDNKADWLLGNADVLIDDSWFNVQQCLSVGMPALLISRPHNRHIKTPYRVKHLSYNEIENKYNELFRVQD